MPAERSQFVDPFGTRWVLWKGVRAGTNGPTLLCLHGFTGSGRDFFPILDQIDEDLVNFIAVDLPGHGQSDSPQSNCSYELTHIIETIDCIRKLAPDPGRVILLGYSMGARIALHYLKDNPRNRGILISGSPGLQPEPERAERRKSDSQWIRKLSDPDFTMDAFCREWESQPLIEPQTRLPQSIAREIAFRRRQNIPVGLANALKTWGTGTLPSLWASLQQQSGHLLVVGEHDRKFVAIAHQMLRENSAFKMAVIPKAGHSPHLENPAATAKAITSFLGEFPI